MTSAHFYLTLLAGIFVICCLFFKLIYHIVLRESNRLDQDLAQYFVGPDLVPKLFAKVISRQQLQAKSNFSSVYLTNLQGSTYYNAFNVYRRELAPGIVSLTGDRAQGDDSKHWAYSSMHLQAE